MNLAYPETNRSLRRMESCWKEDLEEFFRAVRSHVTSFNMSVLSHGSRDTVVFDSWTSESGSAVFP